MADPDSLGQILGNLLSNFIVKPFGMRALVARVRAVTRRALREEPRAGLPDSFVMVGVRIVPAELRAYRGEETIDLSLRDVKILALLHRERGRAVSRDQLFEEAWGLTTPLLSRSIDQHISQLRKRLERDPAEPEIIRTVHGVGYRFECKERL